VYSPEECADGIIHTAAKRPRTDEQQIHPQESVNTVFDLVEPRLHRSVVSRSLCRQFARDLLDHHDLGSLYSILEMLLSDVVLFLLQHI
jgi:hypothetical protein